jgi:hypothetical protein
MKQTTVFALIIILVACTPSGKANENSSVDSFTAVADTISTPVLTAANEEKQVTIITGGLTIKGADTILDVQNQWSFISDPYDFSLDVATIKDLLGEGAVSTEENFEGGEDYGPYSYYTVKDGETEIKFYDYPGKHFSTITTPLLPLKNRIRIGMSKVAFLNAMNFASDSTSHANLFRLSDDYGSMEFRFRADTLNMIYAYWEEGD